MSLTDAKIRSLRPKEKQYKQSDEKGLFLLIKPTGAKLWQHKIRFGGKERLLSYGAYPEVGLADARSKRDGSRKLLSEGIDPALSKRKAKAAAKVSAQDSFGNVASEYIAKRTSEGLAPATVRKAEWFLSLLKAKIGSVPVGEIEPQLLLDALQAIEKGGKHETAKKTRSFASRVFRFAVATSRAKSDPAELLKGALISPKATHYSAVLESSLLGQVLRSVENYTGQPVTCFALRITPHVFLRPGELRMATWDEIDLEKAVWTIPASRMKARRKHALPCPSSEHLAQCAA